jgi:rfaE bifunctional protein nucleotidyltransferase chain/domain
MKPGLVSGTGLPPRGRKAEGPLGSVIGKVLRLEELEKACAAHRAAGRRVALCHGVFDVVHVGHLRHLADARQHGDILVVTITADKWVNKGPDRPAFPEQLRAEMLAGLEIVDHVAIIDEASASPAIQAVKPTAYVKGAEYSDAGKDITGKIVVERQLVESFGGEVVFTHDVVFSSSRLLNRYFAYADSPAKDYLERKRGTDLEVRIAKLLDKAKDLKVVIVGETIIDHYVYVDALGKAAKENIIATLHRGEELFAGGAVAAANHLCALCPDLELVTIIGDPAEGENYEGLLRDQLDERVKLTLLKRPAGPTIRKTRFVEPTYVRKLFEIYQMDDKPLPEETQQAFHRQLAEKVARADLVVVCDFGHGFLNRATVDLLQRHARFLAVNAQSNAGNIGDNLISKYKRPHFVCLDSMEARLAVGEKHAPLTDIVRDRLPEFVNCPNVIVTQGKAGCVVSQTPGDPISIPSFGGAVVDTVGAGDAFYVVAAPILAAGGDCETAGFLGNVAGAIKIGIVGHRRHLTKLELQRYVTTLLK